MQDNHAKDDTLLDAKDNNFAETDHLDEQAELDFDSWHPRPRHETLQEQFEEPHTDDHLGEADEALLEDLGPQPQSEPSGTRSGTDEPGAPFSQPDSSTLCSELPPSNIDASVVPDLSSFQTIFQTRTH